MVSDNYSQTFGSALEINGNRLTYVPQFGVKGSEIAHLISLNTCQYASEVLKRLLQQDCLLSLIKEAMPHACHWNYGRLYLLNCLDLYFTN